MTIRSNVNIRGINTHFSDFELACEQAPEGTFEQAKMIRKLIGDKCDHFLAAAKFEGLKTDNCDGIREIECMMFYMLLDQNPDSEIREAIGLGETLRMHPASAERIINGLQGYGDYARAKGETA